MTAAPRQIIARWRLRNAIAALDDATTELRVAFARYCEAFPDNPFPLPDRLDSRDGCRAGNEAFQDVRSGSGSPGGSTPAGMEAAASPAAASSSSLCAEGSASLLPGADAYHAAPGFSARAPGT